MPLVNLPDGTQAQFPDNMSNDQIETVIKQHLSSKEVNTKPEEPQDTSMPIVDQINAVGGGVASGIVSGVGKVGGLLTDALPDSVKAPLRAAGREVAQTLTPTPDSISGQAMAENPGFAETGKVIGEIAPYAVPGVGAGRAANYGIGAVAGAAQADDGLLNRVTGASLGLATGGVLDATLSGLQTGVQALRSSGLVKKISDQVSKTVSSYTDKLMGTPREVGTKAAAAVYDATKQADSELFNTFRAVKGNIQPEIRKVSRAVEDMLDNYAETITNPQKQILNKALNIMTGEHNLAELHDVRKLLSRSYANFSPIDGPIVADSFNALKKTVDNIMDESAQKLGVLTEYKAANEHFKTKLLPLINSGIDDVSSSLKAVDTDPVKAGEVLDKWMDKNIRPDSPNKTKSFLELLDPKGREAVELRSLERLVQKIQNSDTPALSFKKELDTLGPTVNVLFTGQTKQMINGTKRVLQEAQPMLKFSLKRGDAMNLAPQAVQALLQKALEIPGGQFMLKILGDPGVSKETVKEFLLKGSNILGGQVGNQVANIYNSSESK